MGAFGRAREANMAVNHGTKPLKQVCNIDFSQTVQQMECLGESQIRDSASDVDERGAIRESVRHDLLWKSQGKCR